jgi:hypothetical protein
MTSADTTRRARCLSSVGPGLRLRLGTAPSFWLAALMCLVGCRGPSHQARPQNNAGYTPVNGQQGQPAQGGVRQGPPVAQDAAAGVVFAAVQAALRNDFQGYLSLVHAQERSSPSQLQQIQQFAWARFVKQARWYVDGGGNIQVVRQSPEGQDLMVFVHDFANPGRMPPPVRLRPDQGRWRIVTNSLLLATGRPGERSGRAVQAGREAQGQDWLSTQIGLGEPP